VGRSVLTIPRMCSVMRDYYRTSTMELESTIRLGFGDYLGLGSLDRLIGDLSSKLMYGMGRGQCTKALKLTKPADCNWCWRKSKPAVGIAVCVSPSPMLS
jgi:hypothetical protein